MGSTLQKPLIVAALAAVCLIVTTAAEARGGFSGGRSFSRPSVTRVTPRPSDPKTIIKKNTTIINQSHTTNAAPASSGGGFWSNFLGTTAGVMAGNAIYDAVTDDKDKQAPAPQAAPANPPQAQPQP